MAEAKLKNGKIVNIEKVDKAFIKMVDMMQKICDAIKQLPDEGPFEPPEEMDSMHKRFFKLALLALRERVTIMEIKEEILRMEQVGSVSEFIMNMKQSILQALGVEIIPILGEII
jgi:hypothetical protein